ncbi:MAG: hypothetical protein IKR19_07655 [Acholeplasmatales bacterium]|nr:hypothetical protein [Acholeplasmatales bacterium]
MALFKKKEENGNLGLNRTVTTKAELTKAIDERFGTIIIKGDLFEDIKNDYISTKENTDGKLLLGLGLGLTFIAPIGLASLVGIAALYASSALKGNAKKFRKYVIRIDPNFNKTDELVIQHIDFIGSQREKLTGVESIDAGKKIDLLYDAMKMDVLNITIDRHHLENVYSSLSLTDDKKEQKEINKFKEALFSEGTYNGYRIKREQDKYKFIKIR